MFNTVWLHGYVYAINVQYSSVTRGNDANMAEMQRQLYPLMHRCMASVVVTASVHVLCVLMTAHHRMSMWNIWRLGVLTAIASACARLLLSPHRVMPLFHDAFYVYLCVVCIAPTLTIRVIRPVKTK